MRSAKKRAADLAWLRNNLTKYLRVADEPTDEEREQQAEDERLEGQVAAREAQAEDAGERWLRENDL